MQSVTPAKVSVNWHVAADAQRAALATADLSPYMQGVLDGQHGAICNLDQYDFDGDREEYREGWCEATPTLCEAVIDVLWLPTTPNVGVVEAALDAALDAIFAPVVDADTDVDFDLFDYDAEADDYEGYMADVDFYRTGC